MTNQDTQAWEERLSTAQAAMNPKLVLSVHQKFWLLPFIQQEIAAAEERMVERVLGLIDAECEKIASRPCPHQEETARHEDSCALDGAQHMALTKIRKEVNELLNQLTPSKGEE